MTIAIIIMIIIRSKWIYILLLDCIVAYVNWNCFRLFVYPIVENIHICIYKLNIDLNLHRYKRNSQQQQTALVCFQNEEKTNKQTKQQNNKEKKQLFYVIIICEHFPISAFVRRLQMYWLKWQ